MNKRNFATRKIVSSITCAILIQCISTTTIAQTIPLYKNSRAPINERVKDLLDRMTPTEKFWQLFMIPGDIKPGDAPKYKDGQIGRAHV